MTEQIKLEETQTPTKWCFTAETTTKTGITYIRAYTMRWDKELKKPKRDKRRHVGRLMPDNRIAISDKFLADHPQYAGQDWYWGASHKPVTLDEYRKDFPEKAEQKSVEHEEAGAMESSISVGLTWAAYQVAKAHGIDRHLKAVFGKELGEELLYLSIYKLANGGSMATYDLWRQQHWLPTERRMSSQHISETLASVNSVNINQYFSLRHQRQGESWEEVFKKKPSLRGQCIEYALDSTSISTYSNTIAEAQYGHAKRDPDLRQINYTVVCDQKTGDIVYTHLYDGSVNDVASLKDVLYGMLEAGFDLSQNILVTDRGYSSIMSVQKMLNLDLKFIQGVRQREAAIDREFAKHHNSLTNSAFYDGRLEVFGYKTDELWKQQTEAGQLDAKVNVHLYRMEQICAEQRKLRWTKAKEICELKEEGKRIPTDDWEKYGRYVKESRNTAGKTVWSICTSKLDEDVERACRFVLRTNCVDDPFEALRSYRHRYMVEQDFYQQKNWLGGDRLHVQAKFFHGKVFVNTLATSLRMIIMMSAKRAEKSDPELKIPYDSMDALFQNLEMIRATKRKNANAWVRLTVAAKRRRLLEMLGLREPPRVLSIGSI